jgi:integrase/recombinase XerD
VEEDLDIKFDLRMCRRTFGQRYLDKGLDIESTSVLMGHASTKTTEGFYSRRKLSQAIDKARSLSE